MKQFLKNDSHSKQFAGARPKVYEPQSPRIPVQNDSNETKYPRNPTELPDFVQDHLVIEQCYLSDNTCSNTANVAVDNLPDFTLNSVGKRHSFDCVDNNHPSNPKHPNSLDIPKLDIIDGETADVPESLGRTK